jgi:hypothetical protein
VYLKQFGKQDLLAIYGQATVGGIGVKLILKSIISAMSFVSNLPVHKKSRTLTGSSSLASCRGTKAWANRPRFKTKSPVLANIIFSLPARSVMRLYLSTACAEGKQKCEV